MCLRHTKILFVVAALYLYDTTFGLAEQVVSFMLTAVAQQTSNYFPARSPGLHWKAAAHPKNAPSPDHHVFLFAGDPSKKTSGLVNSWLLKSNMRPGLRSSWRVRLRRGKRSGQPRGHFSGEQLPSGGGRAIDCARTLANSCSSRATRNYFPARCLGLHRKAAAHPKNAPSPDHHVFLFAGDSSKKTSSLVNSCSSRAT